MIKNLLASAGDIRDVGSILGLGRPPGGGNGNLLQYSCLGNPMDRGAWQVTVLKVTESLTRLKQLNMHTHYTHTHKYMHILTYTHIYSHIVCVFMELLKWC